MSLMIFLLEYMNKPNITSYLKTIGNCSMLIPCTNTRYAREARESANCLSSSSSNSR